MSWVAVGVGGASLIGGILGGGASAAASRAQVEYEEQALAQEKSMFNQEQANEQPYIQGGSQAEAQLNYLLGEGTPGSAGQGLGGGGGGGTAYSSSAGGYGSLLQPFTTQDFQSLSPAYQFQLQQGGQGTLNQASSAQGAESGSALSALQSYNQQFANTSFNNAFNQYQTQQNNVFGRLSQLATLGSNAGSNSSTGASAFSGQEANTASSIGASEASGIVGASNAFTGGLTSAGNTYLGQQNLNQILNSGSTVAGNYAGNSPYVAGTPYGSGANSGNTYCDRRMKECIVPRGMDIERGLPVYEFSYKGDQQRHIGFMADEVLAKYPEAVSVGPKGFMMVDYGKL